MSVITDIGFKFSRSTKIGAIQSGASQKVFWKRTHFITLMQASGSLGAFQLEGQHGIMETQQFSKPGVWIFLGEMKLERQVGVSDGVLSVYAGSGVMV